MINIDDNRLWEILSEEACVEGAQAKRIYDRLKETVMDGWIPAEKELPPEPPQYVDDEGDLEEYIVMIDGAERPTVLRYAGDGNWWEDGTYYPVIAWQPLPNPYRPVDKTEKPDWREGMLRKFDKRE